MKELTVLLAPKGDGIDEPRRYRLPEEGGEIPGGRLTFQDVTLRPGRVTLVLGGHTFDVMERALVVDGVEYFWDGEEVIAIE